MKKVQNNNLDNFSFEIEANSLKQKENAPKAIRENIPEGAMYFKAVASNGELNRNGYIIRPNAWKAEKGKFLKDYLLNGKILYQHDAERPIGKPLSAKVVKDQLIIEGWIYDDTYTEGNVGRGLVTSISTGHITLEAEYENTETGEVEDEATFFKDVWEGFEKLWSGVWVMAVTKAELIENSLVTIGSNRTSHIIGNSLISNKLGALTEDQLILLSNKTGMNKKQLEEMKNISFPATNNTEEVETEEVVEAEEETTEEKVVETEEEVTTEEETTEEEVVETEEEETTEEVEKEENKVKKVKKNEFVITKDGLNKMINSAVATLKNDLQKDFNLKINALKEEKREDLANVVKNKKEEEEGVDPKADLKNALRKD